MKRLLSALSWVIVSHFCGSTIEVASAADAPAPVPVSVPVSEKQFLVTHSEADRRFITSIDRHGLHDDSQVHAEAGNDAKRWRADRHGCSGMG
jgi:hypothetical protein